MEFGYSWALLKSWSTLRLLTLRLTLEEEGFERTVASFLRPCKAT